MNNYRVAFFWSFCDIGMMFDYKQSDFNDISDVKRLFENCRDSCLKIGDYWARSPMCQMYNEGWEFLIERFGYEDLFKIKVLVGRIGLSSFIAIWVSIYGVKNHVLLVHTVLQIDKVLQFRLTPKSLSF